MTTVEATHPKTHSEKTVMRGNEAVGEGAIRAGCRYFFGYPITPQNELFEYMAKRLPEVKGMFLQSESELAGVNMLYGAVAGGGRAMTSSSGPGFDLMGEGISLLAASQLPGVVVCVTRSGPGLGRIASSQSDYRMATRGGGGHGDYQTLVFGPNSAQELYELTYRAFELAEAYRNPVIVLSDAILGQMMEPVDLECLPWLEPTIKAWAAQGKGDKPRKVIKAAPYTDDELIEWNRQLKKKYERCKENEQRSESLWTEDAQLILVAFGSSSRIAMDALNRARKDGVRVGMVRPISLWPFPEKALQELLPKAKRFLVVEANNGQMAEDVKLAVCGKAEVIHYGVGGGHIFSPDEIYNEIVRVYKMG